MENKSEITWDEIKKQLREDGIQNAFQLALTDLQILERNWKAKDPALCLQQQGYSTSAAIKHFKHLKDISLDGYRATNFWQEILELPLEKLTITYSPIREIPVEINHLAPSLEIFELAHNADQNLPESIKDLKNLMYLGLAYNGRTTIPDFLKYLPNSCRIELAGNPIPAEEIERFKKEVAAHQLEHEDEGPVISMNENAIGIIWDDI